MKRMNNLFGALLTLPIDTIIKNEKISPKEKVKQIENGENWIVEFWRVRGYEIVKTALGISFTLHKKPEYESRGLGLDLTYLEQFEEEIQQEQAKEIIDELLRNGQIKAVNIIKKFIKINQKTN